MTVDFGHVTRRAVLASFPLPSTLSSSLRFLFLYPTPLVYFCLVFSSLGSCLGAWLGSVQGLSFLVFIVPVLYFLVLFCLVFFKPVLLPLHELAQTQEDS